MAFIESTQKIPPSEVGWVGSDIKTRKGVLIKAHEKAIPVPVTLSSRALPPWIYQSPTELEDVLRISGRSLLLQSLVTFNESDTLANIQQSVLAQAQQLMLPDPKINATAFVDNLSSRDYRIGSNIDLFRMHTDHRKFWTTGDELVKLVKSGAIYPYPGAVEGRDFFYVWENNNIIGISVKLDTANLWTISPPPSSKHRRKPVNIPQSGTNFREKTLKELHVRLPDEQREPNIMSAFVYQTEHPLKIGKIGAGEDFDLIIAPHLTQDPWGQDPYVYTNLHLPARALDGVMLKNNQKVVRSNWHIRVEVSGFAHPDQIGKYMILTAQRRGEPQ